MINMKKILVVGYGSIGKRHVENLLSISNLEVIVCTKRNDIGKLKKHAKVYHSIKQCLEEKPDVGIIANEIGKSRLGSIFRKTIIKFFKRY